MLASIQDLFEDLSQISEKSLAWILGSHLVWALLLALVLIFAGCATYPAKRISIESSLGSYLVMFLGEATEAGVEVPEGNLDSLNTIVFMDMNKTEHIGYCLEEWHADQTGWHLIQSIFVDPEYWMYLNSCERKGLMFHEFGHCLLALEDLHSLEDKKSLMFDSVQWDTSPDCAETQARINVMFSAAKESDTEVERS
jgi:hypothetical protein